MKRSPLSRKTLLRRGRPKPVNRNDPARIAWKEPTGGYCQCGCQRFSMHLEGHHVLEAQLLKREGREDVLWDPRNRMMLAPACHSNHTSAFRRIALKAVPAPAVAFAVEVLGEDRAALYLARMYRADVSRRAA